jgi:hypothetical protein
MLIIVNPQNRTAKCIQDAVDSLRKAFVEEDISFLCDVKQDLIDDEDYEMLANFKELEDEYGWAVPFMIKG